MRIGCFQLIVYEFIESEFVWSVCVCVCFSRLLLAKMGQTVFHSSRGRPRNGLSMSTFEMGNPSYML